MKFLDYFDEHYYELLGTRRKDTFRKIFELLNDKPVCIVETGVARTEGNWRMDGQSTVMFDMYVNVNGGSFTSIDNNKKNIETAKKSLTKNFLTNLICGDSIDELKKLANDKNFPKIDLIYLDSMTVDFKNIVPSATHHLNELKVIMPKLDKGSIIVVDDNDKHFKGEGGKGTYVKRYLEELKVKKIFDEYQMGFIL